MTKEQREDIQGLGDMYSPYIVTPLGHETLIVYKRKGKYYLELSDEVLEEISVSVFCKLNGINYLDRVIMKI